MLLEPGCYGPPGETDVKNQIGDDVAETKYDGLATAAGGRRKRAAFGKHLHVLERAHELRAPVIFVCLLRCPVRHVRVVEEQRVHDLRRRRCYRMRLEAFTLDGAKASQTECDGMPGRRSTILYSPCRPIRRCELFR